MDAFTGEVRILPYTFPPQNWVDCNGQAIGIYQNPALYAVIGQYYGYNSQNQTFNVPDLRGQVAMGTGAGPGLTPRTIAQKTGAESVALNINQMGAHTHTITAKTVAPSISAANMTSTPASDSWLSKAIQVQSSTSTVALYSYTASGTPDVTMASQTFGSAGTATPLAHENRQPYLPLRFCICTAGAFPINPG